MAKSTKSKQLKPTTEVIQEDPKKPVHNRLKPVRKVPVDAYRQNYYYANQKAILANKIQYRKDVKEGKRIPVKKGSKQVQPTIKVPVKSSDAPKKKIMTEKERHAAKLKSNNKWYENNKKTVAEKVQEKQKKANEEKLKNKLDDWEKFKQELGDW